MKTSFNHLDTYLPVYYGCYGHFYLFTNHGKLSFVHVLSEGYLISSISCFSGIKALDNYTRNNIFNYVFSFACVCQSERPVFHTLTAYFYPSTYISLIDEIHNSNHLVFCICILLSMKIENKHLMYVYYFLHNHASFSATDF